MEATMKVFEPCNMSPTRRQLAQFISLCRMFLNFQKLHQFVLMSHVNFYRWFDCSKLIMSDFSLPNHKLASDVQNHIDIFLPR